MEMLAQGAPFDWIAFIAGPGFAIAVAIYLLTQIVPTIKGLVEAVAKMQLSVDRLNDTISYLSHAAQLPAQRMGDKGPANEDR